MLGGIKINSESKIITKELAELVFKQTKNKKFTRDICLFMETDVQKKKLINFIKENNPTLNEINHRSFDIVMSEFEL